MSHRYRDGKPHLWDLPPRGERTGKHDTDGEHEARCTVQGCRARITIDPSDSTEYGHQPGCPHRPDSLARSGQGLSNINTDLVCPECGRGDFESQKGLRSHHYQIHGERLKNTLTCPICEQSFTTPRNDRTYCSTECTYRAQQRQVDIDCEECGDTITVLPSEAAKRKYCSRECQVESMCNRVETECVACGATFDARASCEQKYCSMACLGEDRRDRIEKTCPVCGDQFGTQPSDDKTYCSRACYNEQRGATVAPDERESSTEGVAGD